MSGAGSSGEGSRRLAVLGEAIAAFNRSGPRGLRPFVTERVVFAEPPEQPGAGVFHGRDEAIEAFSRFRETWDAQRSEPRDLIELGDGRILYLSVEHFQGRDGLEVEQPAAVLLSFDGELISRFEGFWDHGNARRAAGIG